MNWNKNLTQLNDALAVLLPFREDVMPILADSGINVAQIRFDSKPSNLWFSIIDYAKNHDRLSALVNTLLLKFPENGYLRSFQENYIYDTGEDIKELVWHKPVNLEKILGRVSTLLPVHFLAKGLDVSRCIVRILVHKKEGTFLGSGFLINDNYILTNNHVIEKKEDAYVATIQFNYELQSDGVPMKTSDYQLDADSGFETSIEDDWSVIKLAGDANVKFGQIILDKIDFETGDYVNIIQHPGGGYKKIGLYRNILTFKSNDVVQYLTDTEPGSSGSPVFNSQWQVVALHNSSGIALEDNARGSLLRNQGININKVIDGLRAKGLL